MEPAQWCKISHGTFPCRKSLQRLAGSHGREVGDGELFEPENCEGIAQGCPTQDVNVGHWHFIHPELLQSTARERREVGHRVAPQLEVFEWQAGQRGEIAD